MDWLPEAKRVPHGGVLHWSQKSDPKGCLHTTESSGWPSYDHWAIPPHATVLPTPDKGVTVHQHIPFSQAAFALENHPGGVQTNRDFVFQFELVGTCDKNGPGYFWPDADDAVLLDLYHKVIEPLNAAFGIPMKARPFQAYPASYGPLSKTNDVRMSGPAFDVYSGWLGHQHVPENVHGDPGAFPWPRLTKLAEDDMALSADDKKWLQTTIQAAAKAAVLEVLTHETIVANKAFAGSPAGTPFTIASVLANIETNQDSDRAALLKPILAAIAKLTPATPPTPPDPPTPPVPDPA